jgi:hypothetical protein
MNPIVKKSLILAVQIVAAVLIVAVLLMFDLVRVRLAY